MYKLSVQNLGNPTIFHHLMPRYAEIISAKCGLVSTVWGFIDGTMRKTCRLTYHQKQMYSGHNRTHGMKFQSVVTPDGLFACMFGAVNGNRHDSFMLNQSLLLPRLQNLMSNGIDLLNHGGGGNTFFFVCRSCISAVGIYFWGISKPTSRFTRSFVECQYVKCLRIG